MIVNGWLSGAQLENLSADPTPGLKGRVFWNTALGKPRVDTGSSIQDLGGSNAGGINYITNPDAEAGTTGWATYADAAGATPVDGTGGSPAITLTRVTSSPLRGIGMFRITKDAVNRQGNGVSYDFSIALADKAKVINLSFDYQVSANFASGDSSDIRAWIYDVTNATLISIAPYTIQGGSGFPFKFSGIFQSASNSTSYRLILHVATTNASAWTFDFDNVFVGPQPILFGAPVSDWQTFSPVTTWTTNTTTTGRWRRVGDSMELDVTLTLSGAPDSTALIITLPSGYSIDTAKLSVSTQYNKGFGAAALRDASSAFFCGIVRYNSATTLVVTPENNGVITQIIPYTWATGDALSFVVSVPIAGWGSSVVMSNDTADRAVAASYNTSSTSVLNGTITTVVFDTKLVDTHGAYNNSTGNFTVPVPGLYAISTFISQTDASATTTRTFQLNKNGTVAAYWVNANSAATNAQKTLGGTVILSLVAGDVITPRYTQVSGGTVTVTNDTSSYISIQRISGQSTVAPTETISAKYTAALTSLPPTVATVFDYSTKVWDTHGAVTTGSSWVFTAPVSGRYSVKASVAVNSTVVQGYTITVYAAGVAKENGYAVRPVTVNYDLNALVATTVRLLAGETIQIKNSVDVNTTTTYTGGAALQFICIDRVGNY